MRAGQLKDDAEMCATSARILSVGTQTCIKAVREGEGSGVLSRKALQG